jgi:hypothetical protein
MNSALLQVATQGLLVDEKTSLSKASSKGVMLTSNASAAPAFSISSIALMHLLAFGSMITAQMKGF